MTKRLGYIQMNEAWAIGNEVGWPDDVILQLLVAHGARLHLEEQFGHLDLTAFSWSLECRTALELAAASRHPGKTLPEKIALDPHAELEQRREQGFEFWPDGTWAKPPLFADGELLDPPEVGIRLVEGHHRLGVLMGLLERKEIAPESLHQCWVACRRSCPD